MVYDVIIVGSGPAGISASLYAKRRKLSVLVISKGKGALGKTEQIDNYYGFPKGISGKELYQNGIEQAKTLGVEIIEDEVVALNYLENFEVETVNSQYTAKSVILATGTNRVTPNIKGIQEFELTKKRMEMKKSKNGAMIVNDCYNANYDSMKAALDYVGKLPNKRKIAVLGDMLELGEYSKELHQKVGKEVAKNKINLLICVGKEVKYMAEQAEEDGMDHNAILLCKNNEEAIEILKKELQPEDVVLLKASNSLNFAQICEAIV